MATFTIDPTVPPNSENPQNGATRIRNVASWILDVLGLNGTIPNTITIPSSPQIDLTSGRILAGALPGATHLRVGNIGTTQLAVTADIVYTADPSSFNLTQNVGFAQGNLVVGVQVGSLPDGRDQAAAFPINAFYHLYCIGGPGLGAATLSSLIGPPTGPTLPASYTSWAYLGTYLLDGSGNVIAEAGLGNTIWYYAQSSVLLAGNAAVNTKIDLSAVVPSIASNVILNCSYSSFTDGSNSMEVDIGITTSTVVFEKIATNAASGAFISGNFQIKVPQANQAIFYRWIHGTTSFLNLSVVGYEVPNGST